MTFILAMSIGYSAVAQKATGPKQDEILKNQQETIAKLEALLEQQTALMNAYGSSMDLQKDLDKLSYSFGVSFGESFKAQGIKEINYTALSKGIVDAMKGEGAKMTGPEAQQYLNEYMAKMIQERAAKAREDGEAFLAKNSERKEVTTTESGLQYEVLEAGEGERPSATSKVTVHYAGRLLDGTEFDSSFKRGQPATFGLNQVIKGWTEGVQLMNPGSKYRFFIPSQLAYGDQGAGQMIGPGETLVFDVELISFE